MNQSVTITPFRSLAQILEGTGAKRPGGPQVSEQLGLMLIDAVAMVAAAFLGTVIQWFYAATPGAGFLYLWTEYRADTGLAIYGALILAALGWLRMLGHYTRRRPFWDETRDVIQVIAVLALLDATLMYSSKLAFSRLWWAITWTSVAVAIPLLRIAWKRSLLKLGRWQRPTLVLGCGPNAVEAAEALNSETLMGLEVIAFANLSPDTSTLTSLVVGDKQLPVISLTAPGSELCRFPALNVVAAVERGELNEHLPFLNRLQRCIADISIVPALKGLPLYGLEPNHFFRHEALFLRLRNNLGRRGPQLVKRLFDVLLSLTLLTLLLPVFAYLAIRVRQDGGPVWFNHERIGRHGRVFQCHKFRTMSPDAPRKLSELLEDPTLKEEWERSYKLRNDPRITAFGALLRRTSLDELPQLWNVLKGEMSLVGPRPVIGDELNRYGEDAAYYLECRPGITGLWQISGRSDVDYRSRVYLDVWYVRNWSLWTDIVVLLKTINVVLRKAGAY